MADDPKEARLLARTRSGDTVAFNSLITLHRERIYMHVFQIIRNEDDTLDLTRETFLRAWKSLTHFDITVPFSSWLHRIATNAAIDLCRGGRRRLQTKITSGALNIDPASPTTPSQSEIPGRSADRAEIAHRVEGVFATLSPEHCAVIVLREIEDLSDKEIAYHIGCTMGTVMSRLFYTRKRLQTLLRDLREEV
jgi:RNA polymerase sigma-70 factor, ECF subfamily